MLDVEGNVDRLLADYRSHELNVLTKDVTGLKKKQENAMHKAAKVFDASLKSDVTNIDELPAFKYAQVCQMYLLLMHLFCQTISS